MTVTQGPDDDNEDFRNLPEGLWKRIRSDPARAPQYLSLAAVERWGDQARAYATRVRAERPDATPQELAQMVKKRHALLARMEGVTAGVPATVFPVAGAVTTIVPDIAAVGSIQT